MSELVQKAVTVYECLILIVVTKIQIRRRKRKTLIPQYKQEKLAQMPATNPNVQTQSQKLQRVE
jgi:hypothetical protein